MAQENCTKDSESLGKISFLENNSELKNIYAKLEIISNIKSLEKLIVNENTIEIDNRYFQSIRRWYNNDNRYLSLIFVESIILTALGFETDIENEIEELEKEIKKLKSPWNKKDHDEDKIQETNEKILKLTEINIQLTTNINKTKKGLNNLSKTYNDDQLVIPRLECLMEKIWNNSNV